MADGVSFLIAALIVAGVCIAAAGAIMIAMSFGWVPTIEVGSRQSKEANAIATGCLGPFVAAGMLYMLGIGAVGALIVAGAIWLAKLLLRLF